ncbi:MAG: ABC transporter substrate-binding protein [Caldilineaceae bacterium]
MNEKSLIAKVTSLHGQRRRTAAESAVDRSHSNRPLSRRQFLQLSAAATVGAAALLSTDVHRTLSAPAAQTSPLPGAYSEAPMLADLVAQGKLPPVEQRLPAHPGVIPVLESTGNYGDVIRRAHKGLSDRWGPTKMIDHGLVWFDQDLVLRSHVAESWQVNADATEWTFTLRAGMKWSDGAPFSSADIQWWYENELANAELTPTPPEQFTTSANRTLMQLAVLDGQTVKFTFAKPNPLFAHRIARSHNIIYAPGHYLAHFHMNLTEDAAALQQEYGAAGFDNWVDYYNDRNAWFINPARPMLSPWVAQNAMTNDKFVMTRNPYFFGVDADNNQLPYVDQVVHNHLALDRLLLQWAANGNIDFQARHISSADLDFYRANEDSGDYTVLDGYAGGHLALQLNLNTTKDRLREFFQRRDVRIALSLAVNRAAINQQIYGGAATPRQYSPLSTSPQAYPSQANAHIAHNVAQANALLDGAGYGAKDANGFRLWPNSSGDPIYFVIKGTDEVDTPNAQALQMVIDDLATVGIQTAYQPLERDAFFGDIGNNRIEAAWWGGDRAVLPLLSPGIFLGTQFDRPWAIAWGAWRRDPNDPLGDEPPAEHWIRHIWSLWDQIAVEADAAEQTRLFTQILDIWATELPMIGILGEFPGPVIRKNGLRNYTSGFPLDDTTGDEHLLNPETLFWAAPEPALDANYATGEPGSFFSLSARNFPPSTNGTVRVNKMPVATVSTDAGGTAQFILDTSQLPAGDYVAAFSVNPVAMIPFILDGAQPLRAKEGDA